MNDIISNYFMQFQELNNKQCNMIKQQMTNIETNESIDMLVNLCKDLVKQNLEIYTSIQGMAIWDGQWLRDLQK